MLQQPQEAEDGGLVAPPGVDSRFDRQPLRQAGMGEAAEVARDGVGLAIRGRKVTPDARGGGEPEEGIEMRAQVGGAAAPGLGDVGDEGGPLRIGERGVGIMRRAGGRVRAPGTRRMVGRRWRRGSELCTREHWNK